MADAMKKSMSLDCLGQVGDDRSQQGQLQVINFWIGLHVQKGLLQVPNGFAGTGDDGDEVFSFRLRGRVGAGSGWSLSFSVRCCSSWIMSSRLRGSAMGSSISARAQSAMAVAYLTGTPRWSQRQCSVSFTSVVLNPRKLSSFSSSSSWTSWLKISLRALVQQLSMKDGFTWSQAWLNRSNVVFRLIFFRTSGMVQDHSRILFINALQ